MIQINHEKLNTLYNIQTYDVNVSISDEYLKESHTELIILYADVLLQTVAYNYHVDRLPATKEGLEAILSQINKDNPQPYSADAYKLIFNISFKGIKEEFLALAEMVKCIEGYFMGLNMTIEFNFILTDMQVQYLILNVNNVIWFNDLHTICIRDSHIDFIYVLYPVMYLCLDNTSTTILSEFYLDYDSPTEERKCYKINAPKIWANMSIQKVNARLQTMNTLGKDKQEFIDWLKIYEDAVYCNTDHVVLLSNYFPNPEKILLVLRNGSQVQYFNYLTNVGALLYEELSDIYFVKNFVHTRLTTESIYTSIDFVIDKFNFNLMYFSYDYEDMLYPYKCKSSELRDIVRYFEQNSDSTSLYNLGSVADVAPFNLHRR